MKLFDYELAADLSLDNPEIPHHIHRVSCDVMSCAYHDGENFCTADHISVGGQTAKSCEETRCGTYRRREVG